jgi:tripartite-type tricarboxylate transporter receptor subunit TctC
MKLYLLGLAIAAVVGQVATASAQPYPSRPVQMIVPFDPGGSVDVIARVMQPTLSAKLGQTVVVINKPGASGTIGSVALVGAKPDGYIIAILAMGSTAMVPHFRKLSYNLESFDFICQVYSAPVLIMVGPNSPYRDIQSLLAFGKANPEKVFYGSPGIGTPDHINMANFLRQNGVVGTHVPYAGSGAAAQALISNQLTVVSNTPVLLRAHQLRPLAVLTSQRLPEWPDVPAAKEFGPPAEASIWAVLAAPKGLPEAVRTELEQACRQTLDDPAYRATAERGGFPPLFRDSNATKTFVVSEFNKYGPIIKSEGLELQ